MTQTSSYDIINRYNTTEVHDDFKNKYIPIIREYAIMTLASAMMGFGLHLFNFPNNFSSGGGTDIIAMIIKKIHELQHRHRADRVGYSDRDLDLIYF